MTENKNYTLKQLKQQLSQLDSYTVGEENLLVCQTLNISKEKLFLMDNFTSKQLKRIQKVLKKRLKNQPLNKIFKVQPFFNLQFFVNKNVLAPRKESELIVQKTLEIVDKSKNAQINLLDICCGCGCLGLTIKSNCKKQINLTLVDISKKALRVAKKNAKLTGQLQNTRFVCSDMFCRLKKNDLFDIIVCNPPYISQKEYDNLSTSVKNFDPKISLVGGKDGLEFYKILAKNAGNYMKKHSKLLIEIGADQLNDVKNIFEQNGFKVDSFKDYSNLDRMLVISY